jgi:hypothetical protein
MDRQKIDCSVSVKSPIGAARDIRLFFQQNKWQRAENDSSRPPPHDGSLLSRNTACFDLKQQAQTAKIDLELAIAGKFDELEKKLK